MVGAQCARYRKHGRPCYRPRLQNLDDYDIVRVYGAEYRSVVNYYLLAKDAWRLCRLRWHAEVSMLKTLALEHQSTVSKMATRHKVKVTTRDGPRTSRTRSRTRHESLESGRGRPGGAQLCARPGNGRLPLRRSRQFRYTGWGRELVVM
ncbi:group II intron reverse transcriptase/maturase [Nonomuraea sp. NPDC050786]|uniref:group II intron reverse transcriptase/maturase n=1 Tax=Nonomuraea sp. NPDC050786 TaxID=3154840 RepID=UPI0033CCCCDB